MANRNRVNVIKIFLFLFSFFPLLLRANPEIKTVGELDALQSQTTYYKALAARNKAKEEVGLITPHQTGGLIETPSRVRHRDQLPYISKIIGNGKTIDVRLRFADGSEMTRKKGDLIPGGFTLSQVSLEEVIITNAAGNKILLSEVAR